MAKVAKNAIIYALIYIRVSTEEQATNSSLGNQLRECEAYCKRMGFAVYKVFEDAGASAKTANRPAFQQMLEFAAINAKKLNIQHVVVYKSDRFARNGNDYVTAKMMLQRYKVQIHSATEFFDDSATGEYMEWILAGQAQFDNRVRAERSRAGTIARLKSGNCTTRPPRGYVRGLPEGPSLFICPEMGEIVRLAFERVAIGQLKDDVRKELFTFGLKSSTGRPLTPAMFNSMLANPIYKGRIVSEKHGIDVEGNFEALITPELYEAVQLVTKHSHSKSAKRNLDHPDFPLRRFVQCGSCLQPMTASWSTGRSKKYGYYFCKNKECGEVKVRKEYLENQWLEVLSKYSVPTDVLKLLDETVKDQWNHRTKSSVQFIGKLILKLEDAVNRQNALTDAFLRTVVSQQAFESQNERIESEITEIKNQIENSAVPNIDVPAVMKFARELLSDLPGSWNRLLPQQKQPFVWSLMPGGVTYTNGSIGTAQTPWFYLGTEPSVSEEIGLAPLTDLSWNQLVSWLTEMDQLRQWMGNSLEST